MSILKEAEWMRKAPISECWDRVKPGLYEIYDRVVAEQGVCEWRPEDIYHACQSGWAELFHADDWKAWVVVQVKPIPFSGGDKALLLWVAWCKKGRAAVRYMPFLRALASDYGCRRIEYWSSFKGMGRINERHGFKPVITMYAVEVD